MSGKFMRRDAVIDTQKGMEAVNSRQRREGTRFAVRTVACGCPDPGCGAFHVVETSRPLPTTDQATATLKTKKKRKKTQALTAKTVE
jgi:hypothetical protein